LPRRCFIRGADASVFDFLRREGWTGVQTGVEIVLDLPYLPPKSVFTPARRAARRVKLGIFSRDEYDHDLINRSRYAHVPKLKYLFRTVPEGEWLGARDDMGLQAALWTTRPAPDCCHVETLLRARTAPAGTMEALVVYAAQVYAARGFRRLSLGESPFVYPNGARGAARWFRLFPIDAFYSAEGLYRFKRKFGGRAEPVFAAARGPLLPALVRAAFAANFHALAWSTVVRA
jgi:hypothetical protein